MTRTQSYIRDSLNSAAKSFNDGDFEKADFICRQLIKEDPNNADAWHFMALIAVKLNKLEDAIKLLKTACEHRPNDFEFLTNLGNLLKVVGDRGEARKCYEQAIAVQPRAIVAYNNLALLLAEEGDLENAITIYERALDIDKNAAEVLLNLSSVYRVKGDMEKAINTCMGAVALKPDLFEFRIHLANIYFESNLISQALEHFEKACQINPSSAIAFNGVGVCQTALGNYSLAKKALLKAIGSLPKLADPQNNLATVHFLLGEFDDAEICLKAALKMRPDYAEALRNYGNLMAAQLQYLTAINFYKNALQIRPDFYEALFELAVAYKNSGEMDLAKSCFADAVKLNPRSLAALCGRVGVSLPSFYRTVEEMEKCRTDYISGLCEIENVIFSKSYDLAEAEESLPFAQPTYLSYQGLNDLEIHKRYGKVLESVMNSRYPRWSAIKPRRVLAPGEKIRLGLVSHNFNNHIDWKIISSGIINQFDRKYFELFAYSTGGNADEVTKLISNRVEHFYRSIDTSEICSQIDNDKIDILFFPELGIDPVSLKIAALRTAAVQCCAWGRADTSGLSTIDYFFSPKIMETKNAQAHYQEKLLLMPEPGFYYQSQHIQDEAIPSISLPDDCVKFLCVQSLFKYMPQYDYIFTEIAKAVPNAKFLFVSRPEALADKFLKRLEKEFLKAGLDSSKFLIMVPRLPYSQFINLCRKSDIFLDSIGYSGCLTALDVIEQNIPIVTTSDALMRSRQSAGLLDLMNLTDIIAENEQAYVSTAIRLAQSAIERDSIKQRISIEKKKLFDNIEVLKYLEETFKSWFKE